MFAYKRASRLVQNTHVVITPLIWRFVRLHRWGITVTLSKRIKQPINEMVAKAEAAGATIPDPVTDYGFMYMHSFEDPDGHRWEFMWMVPNGMPAQQG
jgi:uncharacterized glyoxalase superfamily protein PhnB